MKTPFEAGEPVPLVRQSYSIMLGLAVALAAIALVFGVGVAGSDAALSATSQGAGDHLEVIDAHKDTVVTTVSGDADIVYLADFPAGTFDLNLIGFDEDTESVRFDVDGPINYSRIENYAPYAAFGNRGSNFFGKDIKAGSYTVTVQAYARNRARGAVLGRSVFTFEVQRGSAPTTPTTIVNPTTTSESPTTVPSTATTPSTEAPTTTASDAPTTTERPTTTEQPTTTTAQTTTTQRPTTTEPTTTTSQPTTTEAPTTTERPTTTTEPPTTTTTSDLPPGVHPDIVKVIDVPGRNPGNNWHDSYSVGDQCYCSSTFDHEIGGILVETPDGRKTVREVCEKLGSGPGISNRPVYNDIQCGNGPANNAGDEDDCPGRVDIGRQGCGHIGPKWDLSVFD